MGTFNFVNDPAESTTRDDATIDAIFSKYLEKNIVLQLPQVGCDFDY